MKNRVLLDDPQMDRVRELRSELESLDHVVRPRWEEESDENFCVVMKSVVQLMLGWTEGTIDWYEVRFQLARLFREAEEEDKRE